MPDEVNAPVPTSQRTDPDAYEHETTTDLNDRTGDEPKGFALHTRILLGLLIGIVAGLAASAIFGRVRRRNG